MRANHRPAQRRTPLANGGWRHVFRCDEGSGVTLTDSVSGLVYDSSTATPDTTFSWGTNAAGAKYIAIQTYDTTNGRSLAQGVPCSLTGRSSALVAIARIQTPVAAPNGNNRMIRWGGHHPGNPDIRLNIGQPTFGIVNDDMTEFNYTYYNTENEWDGGYQEDTEPHSMVMAHDLPQGLVEVHIDGTQWGETITGCDADSVGAFNPNASLRLQMAELYFLGVATFTSGLPRNLHDGIAEMKTNVLAGIKKPFAAWRW